VYVQVTPQILACAISGLASIGSSVMAASVKVKANVLAVVKVRVVLCHAEYIRAFLVQVR